MRRASQYCEKNDKEFELRVENLYDLWKSQDGICAISGMRMLHEPNNLRSVSIDRIDGLQGYTLCNVQLVCQWVNFAKNRYSNDEITAVLEEFKNDQMCLLRKTG